MNAITISAMNKFYGTFQVLKNIDLTAAKGGTIVICGPSGSGKSTLIRCINRLEEHQDGSINVLGNALDDNVGHIDLIRREVGMVFHHFNLFPRLTVLENLTLAPMLARKIPQAQAEKTAMTYLDRMRIPEQAQKVPGDLSGGQQKRIAIARALCMAPEIPLFDEPTSAPDPEMISEVPDVMVGLARRNDDGLRDARDGLCPPGRRPRDLHGQGRDRRKRAARDLLWRPAERTDAEIPAPNPLAPGWAQAL